MISVGFTYDLRNDYLAEGYGLEETAEFDAPETIESIRAALTRIGFQVDAIGNLKALVKRLANGDSWDIVFNIAEGLRGIGREAQIPALLEGYGIPYVFSGPEVMITTMDKALAKRLVAEAGVPTAPFAVVSDAASLNEAVRMLPGPLFVKPLAEGTGKGVTSASRVTSKSEMVAICESVWRQFDQPALVEAYLPGREFTVGMTGTGKDAQSIGVLEIGFKPGAEPHANTYQNKQADLEDYSLATDAEAKEAKRVALAAWRTLGCRDGGRIDLRSDANGVPHFLEANPLAGLKPGYSDLPILAAKVGWSYDQLLAEIMAPALARVHGHVLKVVKAS